ncbi:MAG: HlyD family efflux transporter periplasmic adaptor subunit [Pseudomonadota bacterium]
MLAELSIVEQSLKGATDKVVRAEMRSPVDGIVNKIHVNTVGGVVRMGEPIMEITPIDESLFVEIRIDPKDVAFVGPGQPATVKLTAYDFTIYGSLDGKVEVISSDSILDKSTNTSYYLVTIKRVARRSAAKIKNFRLSLEWSQPPISLRGRKVFWSIFSSQLSRRVTRRSASAEWLNRDVDSARLSISTENTLTACTALLALVSSSILLHNPAQAGLEKQAWSPKTQSTKRNPSTQHDGPKLGMFGSMEIEAAGLPDQMKWKKLSERLAEEQNQLEKCSADSNHCAHTVNNWLAALERYRLLSPLAKLQAVNSYAHRAADYTTDSANYRSHDYWATPSEFLQGVGDCEDFAIFKYESLLRLGFSQEDVRLVIVKDDRRKLFHAVVAVQITGRTYIMDSLHNQVVTDDHMFKYRPVRSYSGNNSYMHIVTDAFQIRYLAEVASRQKTPAIQFPDTKTKVQASSHLRMLYECKGCEKLRHARWGSLTFS